MDTKKKRKRVESVEETKPKRKKHLHGDIGSVEHTHANEPLLEEHAQLLDSVKGHLNELTLVTDSYQDLTQSTDDASESPAMKKSKKKSLASEKASEEKSTVVVKDFALEYLRLWDQEKLKWSFKKKTQWWLLQNMYRSSKVIE